MDKKSASSYLFLVPALLIYTSVIVVPTLNSFWISLHDWNGMDDMVFIGLGNYARLFFDDPVFWTAARNNIIWMILTLLFMVSISLCSRLC